MNQRATRIAWRGEPAPCSPSCLSSAGSALRLRKKNKSISNVVPTDGVAMVCLSYLDTTSPARMHYVNLARAAQSRPNAKILLGCWLADGNAASLAATLKPDAMALTLRDAVKSCLARRKAGMQQVAASKNGFPVVAASAA